MQKNLKRKEIEGVLFLVLRLSGIQLYSDNIKSSDNTESKALRYQDNQIDIYSNSWGPGDMGWQVEGPGPKTTRALSNGTKLV